MFTLVAIWFLALRTHERLNLLLTTHQVEKLEIGSPLDIESAGKSQKRSHSHEEESA
jgi:hypothetical protein